MVSFVLYIFSLLSFVSPQALIFKTPIDLFSNHKIRHELNISIFTVIIMRNLLQLVVKSTQHSYTSFDPVFLFFVCRYLNNKDKVC